MGVGRCNPWPRHYPDCALLNPVTTVQRNHPLWRGHDQTQGGTTAVEAWYDGLGAGLEAARCCTRRARARRGRASIVGGRGGSMMALVWACRSPVWWPMCDVRSCAHVTRNTCPKPASTSKPSRPRTVRRPGPPSSPRDEAMRHVPTAGNTAVHPPHAQSLACLLTALQRTPPRPAVAGSVTAVVAGPGAGCAPACPNQPGLRICRPHQQRSPSHRRRCRA